MAVGKLQGACVVLLCLSIAYSVFNFLLGTPTTQFEALRLEEKRKSVLFDNHRINTHYAESSSWSIGDRQQHHDRMTAAVAGVQDHLLDKNLTSKLQTTYSTVPKKQLSRMNEQAATSTYIHSTTKDSDTEQKMLEAPTTGKTIQHIESPNKAVVIGSTRKYLDKPTVARGQDSPKLKNATAKYNGHNYFQLIQEGHFEQWTNGNHTLPPIELMRTYIRDYSQQALEKKWNDCSRCESFQKMKFVVGRYSCPLEAGNRMFKFMNHLVWAILTRRVFLWGHWDEDSCRMEANAGELEAELYCDKMMNSAADCNEILELAKWVPSWDEWSVKLNLTTVKRACTIGTRSHDAIAFPMDGKKVPRVIRVGQQNNLELALILSQKTVPRELLHKPVSQDRARALFGKYGVYFAYGMLFESLFTFHSSLLPGEASKLFAGGSVSDEADAYLLHSRHPLDEDDGSDITLDVSCMQKVIANQTHLSNRPCFVYIMSDRIATRERIPVALLNLSNCTAVFSTSTTSVTTTTGSNISSPRQEHGPFAGRGYFEDVALAVSNVRQGFMAPNKRSRTRVGIRTSSALPRSIIEFRRVLESPSADMIPEFEECIVP